MADADKTVFISYRRQVSSYIARAVFMDLRAHGYDAFLDVESIDSGTFDTIILHQIAARAHFVLILTPGTLERCASAGDWLRREIEQAMALGRNIVPVLANNLRFADAAPYLTGKLSELPRYNALILHEEYFDEAMERLRTRFLKQPVYAPLNPTPPVEQNAVRQKIAEAARKAAPTRAQLTAEQLYNRAWAKWEAADYQGVVADCTEAITLDDHYAPAYNLRGMARLKLGDTVKALIDHNLAIRMDPQTSEYYCNRALVYKTQSKLDQALADYDKSLELGNPEPETPYLGRGIVRYKLQDLQGALADFTSALRHRPGFPAALAWRGATYRDMGRIAEAIADLEQYLAVGGERSGPSTRAEVEEQIRLLRERQGGKKRRTSSK